MIRKRKVNELTVDTQTVITKRCHILVDEDMFKEMLSTRLGVEVGDCDFTQAYNYDEPVYFPINVKWSVQE